MSTVEHDVVTVESYTHPGWCDLRRCEPHRNASRAGGVHESAGTLWSVQSGEADVLVRLVRDDDWDVSGRRNDARTRLHVAVVNNAFEVEVGGVEVGVDPDDAKMLAAILTRYADDAERSDQFRRDIAAGDLPTRL